MIKTISRENYKSLTSEEKRKMENQIRIQQFGFDGILRVIELLETPEDYYIVEEYHEGGDLEIKKRLNDKISEKNCA